MGRIVLDEAYEEPEESPPQERPRHPPRPDVRDYAFVPPSARLGNRMRGPWDSLDCHTRRVLDEPPEVLCQKEVVSWSSSRSQLRSKNSYSQTVPTRIVSSVGNIGNGRNGRPLSARSDASLWSTGPRPPARSRAGSFSAAQSRPQTPSKSQIFRCGVLPLSGKLLVEVVSIFSENEAHLDLELSIPNGSSPPQCISVDETSVRGFSLEVPDVRHDSLLLRLHDVKPVNSMPGGILQSKLSMTTKYATQEYLPAESYKNMWSSRPRALGSLRVPLCGLAADAPGESLEWSVAGTIVRLRVMFFFDEKPEVEAAEAENASHARPSSAPCTRRKGSRDGVVAGSAQSAARTTGFQGRDAPQTTGLHRPATAPAVRSPPIAKQPLDRKEELVEGLLASAKERQGTALAKANSGSNGYDTKVFVESVGESEVQPSFAAISDRSAEISKNLAAADKKPPKHPLRPRPATARSAQPSRAVRPGIHGAEIFHGTQEISGQTHGTGHSAHAGSNRVSRPRSAHGWPGRMLRDNTTGAEMKARTEIAQQQPQQQQQQPEAEPEGESDFLLGGCLITPNSGYQTLEGDNHLRVASTGVQPVVVADAEVSTTEQSSNTPVVPRLAADHGDTLQGSGSAQEGNRSDGGEAAPGDVATTVLNSLWVSVAV